MNEHWIDKAIRENNLPLNLRGHINRARIDADTIRKMLELKNKLSGTNRSIYEESLITDEIPTGA
jgi:hypothetical protein